MNPLTCSHPRCRETPAFKVAAPWSDEHHHGELKTYGFACKAHLDDVRGDALRRRAACRPSPDEVIGDVEVYHYEPGKKDRHLNRLTGPAWHGDAPLFEPERIASGRPGLFDRVTT